MCSFVLLKQEVQANHCTDIERADEEKREELSQLVPHYEALASSSKIHLIQSLVSRLLVEHVFEAYFVGLSKEHGDDILKVEKYLSTFGKIDCHGLQP